MAIFLRGNVWWFEWRTRKERVVKSTGFRKEEKAQAQAVFDAFRLAKGQKPRRSVVEGIFEAIYSSKPIAHAALALTSLWGVYADWMEGKTKFITHKEMVERRGMVERFVEWATRQRGCQDINDVDVMVAREYVGLIRETGRANKTLRKIANCLSNVWEAISQMQTGIHNPWKAALPDNDGTSVRRLAFTEEEEARVLEAAEEVGAAWYAASLISRWTGLRYGDVARLQWEQIDMVNRVIDLTPSKTQRHGVKVLIPIAEPLYEMFKRASLPIDAAPGYIPEGFLLPGHALTYPHPFLPPFSDVLRKCGLSTDLYSFHSWRHTFRTRLAEAGVPDEVARRLGGWTNLEMAKHYDHASHLGEMRQAMAAMTMVKNR